MKAAVVGSGSWGTALALVLCGNGHDVTLWSRTPAKAEALARELGCAAGTAEQAAREGAYIFLGVKPQMMGGLLADVAPVLAARQDRFVLVTMATGLTIARIRELAGRSYPVIRIMPNTPVSIGAGMVQYAYSENVADSDLQAFLEAFAWAGRFSSIPEFRMDAGSAVSACGPAFADIFLEAMADGGVACGLSREQAMELAAQMLLGTAKLALESGQQSVVAESFFLESGFEQTWVALHQVAHDHGHLHHKLPVAVLGGAGFLLFRDVDVLAFVHLAVLFGPCHGAGEFLFIVYAFGHTAHDLSHVHRLIAHAQIFLEEVGIDHGSGYAHGHAAERQIGLAPHLSHGESRTGETEQLLCHIGRNSVVGEVLYVVAVDAESRQAFLGMCGKNGGKIDGSGPLSAVESPHGLGPIGVHVHGFTAIAPARGHSDGGADAFALEFFGTCGGFRHTAYGSVGDHALHGRSVGIAEIG